MSSITWSMGVGFVLTDLGGNLVGLCEVSSSESLLFVFEHNLPQVVQQFQLRHLEDSPFIGVWHNLDIVYVDAADRSRMPNGLNGDGFGVVGDAEYSARLGPQRCSLRGLEPLLQASRLEIR